MLRIRLKVIYDIADSGELAEIVILDLDSESFFTLHNEIGKLDGIDSKVIGKLRIHSNFIALDLKLVNEQIYKLLVHNFLLLS